VLKLSGLLDVRHTRSAQFAMLMDGIRNRATGYDHRNSEEKVLNRRFGKTAVAAVVAGALLLFVAAPRVQGDERDKCRHPIEKAEARLDRAIRNRGEHSREAEDRRRDLYAERERCWNQHHQWWNGKDHRWETEHNWEHDHDNDHH
jgi:hypothetical protein